MVLTNMPDKSSTINCKLKILTLFVKKIAFNQIFFVPLHLIYANRHLIHIYAAAFL